jgi:hypothetical protein
MIFPAKLSSHRPHYSNRQLTVVHYRLGSIAERLQLH